MSAVRDFEELAIFQKARELSKKIYLVTNKDGFKSDFRFVQQIRAAVNGFWRKSIINGAAAMKGEVMKLKNG